MHLKKFLFAILFIFLNISCTSALKRECEEKNWSDQGYKDAMLGHKKQRVAFHRTRCQKEEISVDVQVYNLGWSQGQTKYCSKNNAKELGQTGKKYKNICPQEVWDEFVKSHIEGVEIFCQPQSGYELGRKGIKYNSICPKLLEIEFLNKYFVGHSEFLSVKVTQLESKIKSLEYEINSKDSEISSLEDTVSDLEDKIRNQ